MTHLQPHKQGASPATWLPQHWMIVLLTLVVCLCSNSAMAQGLPAGSCTTDPQYAISTPAPGTGLVSAIVFYIASLLSAWVQMMFTFVAGAVAPAIGGGIALYVAIYGMFFTLGLVSLNAADVVMRLAKLSIVSLFAFASSWGLYDAYVVQLFNNGVDTIISQISSIAVSMAPGLTASAPFAPIDNAVALLLSARMIVTLVGYVFTGPYGALFALLIGHGILTFGRCVLEALWTYLLSLVIRSLLLALAPVFVPTILFSRTRHLFDGWLNQILNTCFQPIFIFTFFGMFAKMIEATVWRILYIPVCWTPLETYSGAPFFTHMWRPTVMEGGTWKMSSQDWTFTGLAGGSVMFPINLIEVAIFLFLTFVALRFNSVAISAAKEISGASTSLNQIGALPAFVKQIRDAFKSAKPQKVAVAAATAAGVTGGLMAASAAQQAAAGTGQRTGADGVTPLSGSVSAGGTSSSSSTTTGVDGTSSSSSGSAASSYTDAQRGGAGVVGGRTGTAGSSGASGTGTSQAGKGGTAAANDNAGSNYDPVKLFPGPKKAQAAAGASTGLFGFMGQLFDGGRSKQKQMRKAKMGKAFAGKNMPGGPLAFGDTRKMTATPTEEMSKEERTKKAAAEADNFVSRQEIIGDAQFALAERELAHAKLRLAEEQLKTAKATKAGGEAIREAAEKKREAQLAAKQMDRQNNPAGVMAEMGSKLRALMPGGGGKKLGRGAAKKQAEQALKRAQQYTMRGSVESARPGFGLFDEEKIPGKEARRLKGRMKKNVTDSETLSRDEAMILATEQRIAEQRAAMKELVDVQREYAAGIAAGKTPEQMQDLLQRQKAAQQAGGTASPLDSLMTLKQGMTRNHAERAAALKQQRREKQMEELTGSRQGKGKSSKTVSRRDLKAMEQQQLSGAQQGVIGAFMDMFRSEKDITPERADNAGRPIREGREDQQPEAAPRSRAQEAYDDRRAEIVQQAQEELSPQRKEFAEARLDAAKEAYAEAVRTHKGVSDASKDLHEARAAMQRAERGLNAGGVMAHMQSELRKALGQLRKDTLKEKREEKLKGNKKGGDEEAAEDTVARPEIQAPVVPEGKDRGEPQREAAAPASNEPGSSPENPIVVADNMKTLSELRKEAQAKGPNEESLVLLDMARQNLEGRADENVMGLLDKAKEALQKGDEAGAKEAAELMLSAKTLLNFDQSTTDAPGYTMQEGSFQQYRQSSAQHWLDQSLSTLPKGGRLSLEQAKASPLAGVASLISSLPAALRPSEKAMNALRGDKGKDIEQDKKALLELRKELQEKMEGAEHVLRGNTARSWEKLQNQLKKDDPKERRETTFAQPDAKSAETLENIDRLLRTSGKAMGLDLEGAKEKGDLPAAAAPEREEGSLLRKADEGERGQAVRDYMDYLKTRTDEMKSVNAATFDEWLKDREGKYSDEQQDYADEYLKKLRADDRSVDNMMRMIEKDELVSSFALNRTVEISRGEEEIIPVRDEAFQFAPQPADDSAALEKSVEDLNSWSVAPQREEGALDWNMTAPLEELSQSMDKMEAAMAETKKSMTTLDDALHDFMDGSKSNATDDLIKKVTTFFADSHMMTDLLSSATGDMGEAAERFESKLDELSAVFDEDGALDPATKAHTEAMRRAEKLARKMAEEMEEMEEQMRHMRRHSGDHH